MTGALVSVTPAHAQVAQQNHNLAANTLTLNDRQVEYDMVPFSYLTKDKDSRFGTREIHQNHRNNLRGERLPYGAVDMSFQAYPHWMVIDVQNNSRKSDWVLDFGSMMQGRTGVFPRIMINDGQRDTLLLDGLPRAGAHNLGAGLNRYSLPLTIMPGQRVSLVMYFVPSDHTPSVIMPRLLEAGAYLKAGGSSGDFDLQRLIFLMMVGASAYFAGSVFLRRGYSFVPHTLFFASQASWFWLASERIFTSLPAAAHLPGIANITSGLLALAATQSIVASQDKEEGDGVLMYICASFALLALVAFVFGLPSGSILRPVVAYGVGGLAFFVAAIRAFSVPGELRASGIFLGFAWLCMLVGTLIPPLTAAEYVPHSSLFLHMNWLVMPFVAVLAIISGSLQIRAHNLGIVRDVLRQAHRAQTLTRMKQTQESADQARLMRVIEREREIMEDLRNRDAERTEEMHKARIVADEANRAKSAFLAVVSHEIRTPMTGIMGMLRLLQDSQLSDQQRDYALTIKDSGDAMLALLNDILDFSKIQSGGMDIEVIDFDLQRVVHSVIMLMHGHAAAKGIQLKSDIPDNTPRYLKGDPTRLRQILLNLVGNAIKFTSKGSVTVRVQPGNAVADAPLGSLPIYFAVEDTGIGISASAQENLFNPFSQADSSIARKFGGTGLGLAICKRLIEVMGSTIKLDSEEGRGTTFYFTLHMMAGDASVIEDAEHAANAPALAQALHILVVDDNMINRKVIEALLQRDDHIVTCAESGAEALELLQQQKFDLVLMDIEMPGMDGVSTLKALRQSDAPCRDVPIVALTGNIGKDDIDGYLAAGMQAVLGKPIDPEALRRVMLDVGGTRTDKPVSNEAPIASEPVINDEPVVYTPAPAIEPEMALKPDTDITEPVDDVAVYTPQIDEAPVEAALVDAPPSMDVELINDGLIKTLRDSLGVESLSDMISSVITHNTDSLPRLHAAFNANDLTELGAIAHELKGMNANFGLNAVSQICGRLEHGVRNNSLGADTISELVFNALPEAMSQSERVLLGQD